MYNIVNNNASFVFARYSYATDLRGNDVQSYLQPVNIYNYLLQYSES